MNKVIEEILKKKPHLDGPLRFYESTLEFMESVKALKISPRPEKNAYSPETVDVIFERFTSYITLPEGSLSPLKRAMELGDIDFTRLPLGEVPAFSLPYAEDDLAMLLYLVSKPYFHALREACRLDGRAWEGGMCPVCNGRPSITWIDDGRRLVSCSFCGARGYVDRAGCPLCLTVDEAKQKALLFDGEDGFRINTCDHCGSYVKDIGADLIAGLSPELADLVSLPLDFVVQEKGFQRRSPNPIGMRKITTRG